MGIKRIDINEFNEHNIAPYNATSIGVYDNDNNYIGKVKLNSLKRDFSNRLYGVGLLSDTHYNDYDNYYNPDIIAVDDGSEYEGDFVNALELYKNNEDIDFICVAGDITSDKIENVINFNSKREKHCPNTYIYSCVGNHDNAAIYNNDNIEESINIWNSYVSNFNDNLEKHYDIYDKTSFYFIKTLPSGNKDVYIFLNICFGNIGTNASGNDTDGEPDDPHRSHQYYHPQTLNWFKNVLETHKHDRCFVFTHLFFKQKAGNNNSGNKFQYAARDKNYYLNGEQFLFLNDLNNKYKNSIWFTGHSHYCWEWQKYDKDINISNHDYDYTNKSLYGGITIRKKLDVCAYNVHLPSLARPLKISTGYSVDMKRSEGAIMDVYEDFVDIRGIVFKTSNETNYSNKYCPLAIYRIPIGGNNIKRIDD